MLDIGNSNFLIILKKLVAEQGKEALLNPVKCKAFLADYTKGEYKKESRLLLQALDAGISKAIDSADNLEICKKQQIRVLHEEYSLVEETAENIVDILIMILRGKIKEKKLCKKCGRELVEEWKSCPNCKTISKNHETVIVKTKPLAKSSSSNQVKQKLHNGKKRIYKYSFLSILGLILVYFFIFILNEKSFKNDFIVKILDNGNIEITGYKGKDSILEIPSQIMNRSITVIGERAFENYKLTSVTIPNSVTQIGSYAFANNQLTSVIIPNSVTQIGSYAFVNNRISSVTIPNIVTRIGDGAFARNSIAYLTIPDSVTYIGIMAFANNQITSVIIPNNVTTIRSSAFENNKLTTITISNNVTQIENKVFYQNLLTSVTIPNKVTRIGDYAFGNNKLISVTIPNNVTRIGSYSFQDNILTSIIIPNSVTVIGFGAFYNNRLTSITIPNSVRRIEESAFRLNQINFVTISRNTEIINSFDHNVVVTRR